MAGGGGWTSRLQHIHRRGGNGRGHTSDVVAKLRPSAQLGSEVALRAAVDIVHVVQERLLEAHEIDELAVFELHPPCVDLIQLIQHFLVCLHEQKKQSWIDTTRRNNAATRYSWRRMAASTGKTLTLQPLSARARMCLWALVVVCAASSLVLYVDT